MSLRFSSNKVHPVKTITDKSDGVQNEANTPKISLLPKKFGLFDGAAHIIGVVIGSGIFISPVVVLKNCGSPGMSLVIWAVAGIISFFGSICFAELAIMIPESGGKYNYIRTGYGELFGFLFTWTTFFILRPGSEAVKSLTLATYVTEEFFPTNCANPTTEGNKEITTKLIASVVLIFLVLLNAMAEVKWIIRLSNSLSSLKVLILLVIIASGLSSLLTTDLRNDVARFNIQYENMISGTSDQPNAYISAIIGAFWAYSGYDATCEIAEEIKEPFKRNMLGAATIALTIVTFVYILTNFSYFLLLSPSEMLSSDAVAVTFGNKFHPIFGMVIKGFVCLSIFGSINVGLISGSRLALVAARRGHLPKQLSLVNVNRFTPVASLLALMCLSLIMVWLRNLKSLLYLTTYLSQIWLGMCILFLVVVKLFQYNIISNLFRSCSKKDIQNDSEDENIKSKDDLDEKDRKMIQIIQTIHKLSQQKYEKFSMPLIIPLIYFSVCLIVLTIPVIYDINRLLYTFIFLGTGIPFYFAFLWPNNLPDWIKLSNAKIMLVFQKLFFAIPDEIKA